MKRIDHPVILTGKSVRLEPLSEIHFDDLVIIAAAPAIWENLPIDGTNKARLLSELKTALLHRANATQYPFVVIDTLTGKPIGSTRLIDIFPEHNKLEIGWTWYEPAYWGKGHNVECKLLLLRYVFEVLGVNRVQLKTRNTNMRSRAAIEKIGAKFEGILRKDRVAPDGQVRDTYLYSIIDEDWGEVEQRLLAMVSGRDAIAT